MHDSSSHKKGIKFFTGGSMHLNIAFSVFSLVIIGGCATSIPPPQLSLDAGADVVIVAKSDPGDNYETLGPISGSDGFGCGSLTGYFGTYERATTVLRNKVKSLGGTYAQIISLTEPYLRGDCFDNEFSIRATAYKQIRDRPSPTPIIDAGEERLTKKLRELKNLFDDGILTRAEYENQKANLLSKGF